MNVQYWTPALGSRARLFRLGQGTPSGLCAARCAPVHESPELRLVQPADPVSHLAEASDLHQLQAGIPAGSLQGIRPPTDDHLLFQVVAAREPPDFMRPDPDPGVPLDQHHHGHVDHESRSARSLHSSIDRDP